VDVFARKKEEKGDYSEVEKKRRPPVHKERVSKQKKKERKKYKTYRRKMYTALCCSRSINPFR
jgi:hypothetical protein